MNEYRIRLAQEQDLRAALEMKLQAWREAYSSFRDEGFFAHHESQLDQQLAWWERGLAGGAQFWIAETGDGKIVGLAGGTPTIEEDQDAGVDIELGVLYVLKEYYGTGLAAHLMDTVLSRRDALLWVLEGNARAINFYTKHGFVPDGTSEELVGSWAGLREQRMVRKHG